MLKKRKKDLDSRVIHVVSSDSAYLESAKALKAAYKIAKYNRDLEAIIAIADRWAAIAKYLETDSDMRIPMGFSSAAKEE